jgi:hypothetical protein
MLQTVPDISDGYKNSRNKNRNKGKNMSKCPYDGFECETQTKRIDKWKYMVHNVAPKDGRVFYTSADMFENCEDKDTCIRYINLMRQPPQKTK